MNEPKFTDFEKKNSSEIAIFRQSVSTCHKKMAGFSKIKIKLVFSLA